MDYQNQIVDAHFHLWNPERLQYNWLENFPSIQRTYTINEYWKEIPDTTIEKLVFIQCECRPEQYLQEIELVNEIAKTDSRIQGIVCWFPLEESNVSFKLTELQQHKLVCGIRRLEESPLSLYTNPQFITNLRSLPKYNFSFDLCVKPNQLAQVVNLVQKCPETSFVLDHLGKPNTPATEITEWKKNIKSLSQCPLVYAKLSGLVPEAEGKIWTSTESQDYFNYALDSFGADRLIFGSDWPVVNLSSSFQQWLDVLMDWCQGLSEDELSKIFRKNAIRFYGLNE